MADKQRGDKGEGRTHKPEGQPAGYQPVGGESTKEPAAGRPDYTVTSPETGETPEGTVVVGAPGDPGVWEGFRLTAAQAEAVLSDPKREKAVRAGNVVLSGMSAEDYLRHCIQADLTAEGAPLVTERARLEAELRKRLAQLGA